MSWILHKVRQMRVAANTLLVVISSLSIAAAEQQQRLPAVMDVALSSEGHLISRCEDANGSPVRDAVVEVVRGEDLICWTTSGSDGSFTLRDIKPGIYRLRCQDCDRSIRAWSDKVAPPVARLPFVIVVAAAPLPVASEDMPPPSTGGDSRAGAAGEPGGDAQKPILQLQPQDGAQRKTTAAVQQAAVLPPAAEAVPQIGANLPHTHTHAHHNIETGAADAVFDPFAGIQLDPRRPYAPEFGNVTEQPLTAPAQAQQEQQQQQQLPPQQQAQQQPPRQPNSPPAVHPGAQEVPPCGDVRYIRSGVGPTVGDVVVTSFGIAGITMGIIGIHKYENRKVRRVVSP